MLVRELMSERRFEVIHRDTLIIDAAKILERKKISGAPLVDDAGKVVGIVSKSDIVHFELVGDDPNMGSVWEIGSRRVQTVRDSASVREAARIMLDAHIHRLLVVDDDDEPAGMLTAFDFVRHVAES